MSRRNSNTDKKPEEQTESKAAGSEAPKTEPTTPPVARKGCVTFSSRFESYRLTLGPGDSSNPPEVVQFSNGRADVSDKAVIEKMRAHPLLGNEFHEIAAG